VTNGDDFVAWLFALVVACGLMYVPFHGHRPRQWIPVFVASFKKGPIQTLLTVALYACVAAWFSWLLSWGSISTGWSGVAVVIVFVLFWVSLKLRI
jgi:hypothetical protein